MNHEFTVLGPVEVYVDLQAGDLRVTATPIDTATPTFTACVDVIGSHADQVRVELEGDRLSIFEPRRAGFRSPTGGLQVAVTVPSGSGLAGKLGAATVRASGELGALRLSTGAGDVTLGAVLGTALLKTGAGDITVDSLSGESEIKAGAGTITVGRVMAPTQLKTGAGAIHVGEATAPVALKSGSGDLSVGVAEDDVTLSAASGDIRVARMSRGQAGLKNVSGDIRLGVPEGTPVWTDVSTTTGRVFSTLPRTGAPVQGQPYVEVRARSLSGDIHLEPRGPLRKDPS